MNEERLSARVSLPVPLSLQVDNFSLYENKTRVDVDFSDGVTCLAGANGLGKSTFLNLVNFAITGVVAEPGRKFESLPEYVRHTAPYAASYFDGRVARRDREAATVRLEMQVGSAVYRLERGIFEGQNLRALEVVDERVGSGLRSLDFDNDSARGAAYQQMLATDCGLASYDQVVFLQHFLLTFDEQHRLLLWDDRTLDQALLLAFGVDSALAARADQIRRQAERFESQARNLQYQATTADSRVQELLAGFDQDLGVADTPDVADADVVEGELSALADRIERLSLEISSAHNEEAIAHSRLASCESNFEAAAAEVVSVSPHRHPTIAAVMLSGSCDVCGANDVAPRIQAKLSENECPLCGERLADSREDPERLVAVANELDAARRETRLASESVARKVLEKRELLKKVETIESQLSEGALGEMDLKNQRALVQRMVLRYQAEAEDARERRDEFRRKRDERRSELKPIASALAAKYRDGEAEFVPGFTMLAERFLGLPVDVTLHQRAEKTSLIVTVGGTERRTFDQLSESQRYFLDIAFRMALIDFMARGEGGSLMVDTPEGSLDISYEARAGAMFSAFVSGRNRVIMTANINSSQLLLTMARILTSESMLVVRMIEWSPLSDVQAEGEALFDDAFQRLSTALEGSEVA